MKRHSPNWQSGSKAAACVCLLLLAPLALFAQGSTAAKPPTVEQFAGNYKGTAKETGGVVQLTLEIKTEKGQVTGRLVALKKEQAITSGEIGQGKLKLKLEAGDTPATLVLLQRDNKLSGDWTVGKQTLPVEFEPLPEVVETTAVALAKVAEPSGAELITGQWEAAADANGQTVPFTLVLKVEGEKVTGGSSSQMLGDSTISSGSWKDGKLAIVLDGGGGQVALVATLVEGKLAGDYDYAGQLQGKWVAVKKKP